MTLDKAPTAAMVDELKARLREHAKRQVANNYSIAAEYLDYVEKLLRGKGEEKK